MEGNAWIGNKFCKVFFVKARDVNFDKTKVKAYAESEEYTTDGDVCEIYMRYKKTNLNDVYEIEEYGEQGYFKECKKGRGASLYYYQEIIY